MFRQLGVSPQTERTTPNDRLHEPRTSLVYDQSIQRQTIRNDLQVSGFSAP
jgi:hypothetical protein